MEENKKKRFKDEQLDHVMTMVTMMTDVKKAENILAGIAILSELVIADIKLDMFKTALQHMSVEQDANGNEFITCKIIPGEENYDLLKEAIEHGFEQEDDEDPNEDANAYA